MSSIYFDHNATTALDHRVLNAMLPWMQNQSGNATSRHFFGRAARDAIEYARTQVADACGAYASQVVFTSCGTEANNFAVKGIASMRPATTFKQILTSAIEHPCVTQPANAMQKLGYLSHQIAVNLEGQLDLEKFKLQLQTPTALVSVMLANNETGVVQALNAVSELAGKAGTAVHTDAVQAFGKIDVNFQDLNVDAMTISSHKIHGPQGAAALIVNKKLDIRPLLDGGGQEKGLRSGTENIAAIVGFGEACALAIKDKAHFYTHTKALRTQLEIGLRALNVRIFGSQAERITNTCFFAVEGIEGETLVMALDRKGYALASGSACSSDSTEPSHVLLAMGVPADLARGAIRVSFGAHNTAEQVAGFLSTLKSEMVRLKQMSAIAA